MSKLSTERAIEALYTVRAYYASLTAGYPKGKDCKGIGDVMCSEIANSCLMAIKTLEQTRWIPVSERLPKDLEPVNITWVNHEPEPYYHDIKNKNFVATGIHYRGQWYWYSTTCADYLGEYGSNDIDKVDDAVEIVAWMPLPEPAREDFING